jgi:hypothetical protein
MKTFIKFVKKSDNAESQPSSEPLLAFSMTCDITETAFRDESVGGLYGLPFESLVEFPLGNAISPSKLFKCNQFMLTCTHCKSHSGSMANELLLIGRSWYVLTPDGVLGTVYIKSFFFSAHSWGAET